MLWQSTTDMPKKKQHDANESSNRWIQAIRDAEARIVMLEKDRARLRRAVRLMKQQVEEGVPFPSVVPVDGNGA